MSKQLELNYKVHRALGLTEDGVDYQGTTEHSKAYAGTVVPNYSGSMPLAMEALLSLSDFYYINIEIGAGLKVTLTSPLDVVVRDGTRGVEDAAITICEAIASTTLEIKGLTSDTK